MASKKFRKIVVDGNVYLWVFSPGYMRLPVDYIAYQAYDTFKAYAEDNRTSPLQITFITWECSISGGPLRIGAPIDLGDPSTGGVNLHTPKWAATLIREGLKRGWKANAKSAPLTIENGVDLLADLNYKAD